MLLYIEGMVASKMVSQFMISPLKGNSKEVSAGAFNKLEEAVSAAGDVSTINDFDELFAYLLAGDTVILLHGYPKAIIVSAKEKSGRNISEPTTQNVVRGPQEGFTEMLRMNTALIRRRLRTPHLRVDARVLGRYTNTNIAVMYIDGIANPKVIEEVMRRIDEIDIDSILESGNVEDLIQDSTYSPFPTMFNTERPDVVTAEMLEGRVAILVDGSPFALIVPATFTQFFQAAEDYYNRSDFGIIRLLRYIAFFLALLTPSLFVGIKTFHQELIPTQLIIDLAAQREGVPFPAIVEALLMEVTFEILREAGVRMPRAVGQAISIVGALVIGQAAVEAGLVTPAMVIVVSITAISSFVFPSYNMAISIRLLRFVFMILAASFGLFGIAVGLFMLLLHLSSLRSFGVPYMAPIAPYNNTDQKDAIFHLPLKFLNTRPRLIGQQNNTRQQSHGKFKKN